MHPFLSFVLILSIVRAFDTTPNTTLRKFPINSVISNQWPWLTTNGNRIHAHGGQVLEYNNKFYWVGTTQKLHNREFLSMGINCYVSTDLQHWNFEKLIFRNTSIVGVPTKYGQYRIERPKVLYNVMSKSFVMWFHLDSAGFKLRMVGVARLSGNPSSPCSGEYSFVSGFQPDGRPSLDMGLYQDDDQTAYLVRSVDNKFAGISQLTPDYLNTTKDGIISKGPRIEGVTIFKYPTHSGTPIYYLLGSHLTGWAPNPAVLCHAQTSTLHGAQWQGCGNPTPSRTTFGSQSTFALRVRDTGDRFLYVFMADIWNHPNVTNATYLWLPMDLQKNHPKRVSITYRQSWEVKNHIV